MIYHTATNHFSPRAPRALFVWLHITILTKEVFKVLAKQMQSDGGYQSQPAIIHNAPVIITKSSFLTDLSMQYNANYVA